MKILSQDTIVVNAIKRILEGYHYLEHNESKSSDDFLYVDVIDEKPDSADMDRIHIVEAQNLRSFVSETTYCESN